jgi:hypothetical protein
LPEVIEMKKIIVSISVVVVALAMIFGLPAWEEEESPVAAEKMADDQNHEMTETGKEFEEEIISGNLTAIDLSVDEGLSEASGP